METEESKNYACSKFDKLIEMNNFLSKYNAQISRKY